MLLNTNFSEYSSSVPTYWNVKNQSIIGTTDNVTLIKSASSTSGSNAVNVVTKNPCSGIEQTFLSAYPSKLTCTLNNTSGRSFINLAKEDDTSAFMETSQQSNYGFLSCNGVNVVRLNNGKLAKFFSLSNSEETSGDSGQLYIQCEGEDKRLIQADSTCQQLMSTCIQYDNKEVIIYHKIQNSKTTVSILESTDSFATISRSIDLLIYTEDMQCYSAIKCSNGKTILPYLRATNGVYYLDILVSNDDLATWTTLNQFKVCSQRGLMETKAVELNNGKVILLSRTELGYLAKNTLDLSTMTLSEYSLTDIATSSTAFSIKRVADNKMAIAWNSVNIDNNGGLGANYPRMFICLGFYDGNLNNLKSLSVVATNSTYNFTTTSTLPYIHSPVISLDKNNTDDIYISYETVFSSTVVYSALSKGSIDALSSLNNSATNSGDNTISVDIPVGTFRLQFLSAVDKTSNFTIDNVKLNNVKLNNDILKLKVEDKIVDVPLKVIDNDYTYIHLYNDNDNRGLSLSEVENINDVINNGYKYELKINDDGLIKTLLCIK